MSEGVRLIAAERDRQITVEGYTAEHDEGYTAELLAAADCYRRVAYAQVLPGRVAILDTPPPTWPWAFRYWKPALDPIRNMVKAGALTAAAIDSLKAERGETS